MYTHIYRHNFVHQKHFTGKHNQGKRISSRTFAPTITVIRSNARQIPLNNCLYQIACKLFFNCEEKLLVSAPNPVNLLPSTTKESAEFFNLSGELIHLFGAWRAPAPALSSVLLSKAVLWAFWSRAIDFCWRASVCVRVVVREKVLTSLVEWPLTLPQAA